VLDYVRSVVKTSLSTILGDSSAGESYDKKFFVCIKQYVFQCISRMDLPTNRSPSNAIIRVDMYTYKYNFASKGAISVHKNILAYILCISASPSLTTEM
jgi:hypothetical protein